MELVKIGKALLEELTLFVCCIVCLLHELCKLLLVALILKGQSRAADSGVGRGESLVGTRMGLCDVKSSCCQQCRSRKR